MIALVLLVVVAATLVQPGKAEAIEPMMVMTIVGAAVVVVLIIAVVIIANVREGQGSADRGEAVVIAFEPGAVQGQ